MLRKGWCQELLARRQQPFFLKSATILCVIGKARGQLALSGNAEGNGLLTRIALVSLVLFVLCTIL